MADFFSQGFSRIFAIPSDVSSAYSPDDAAANNANAAANVTGAVGGSGGKKVTKKKGHSRTLTPLSLTDGNGTITSQSFGEGTLSYGSASLDDDDEGTGTLDEEDEELESKSSTSSETMEEHGDDDDDDDDDTDEKGRSRFASTAVIAATNAHGRGRQQRNDKPAHRSSSERPTVRNNNGGTTGNNGNGSGRTEERKKYRSSSVAVSSLGRRTSGGTSGSGATLNVNVVPTRKNNMTLQLNSPTKKNQKDHRHRSANNNRHRSSSSKAGARASGATRGELARVNSWSSGEEDEEGDRSRRRARSASAHGRSDAKRSVSNSGRSNNKKKDNGSTLDSSNNSSNRTGTTNTTNRTTNTATTPSPNTKAKKSKEKKEKKQSNGWRSKFSGSMKKHLSPGTASAAGTPPQPKSKTKSGNNKKKQYSTKGATTAQIPSTPEDAQLLNNKKHHHKAAAAKKGGNGGGGGKLNLPPSVSNQRNPINVGDSIVISQQFLEECGDMSVLTMPKELAAMNEERAIASEFDRTIQEVGQRTVMENDRVQAYLDARRAGEGQEIIPSNSTGISTVNGRGMIYEKIGAYASRVLEADALGVINGNGNGGNGIYPSYSQESHHNLQQLQHQRSMVHDQGEEGIEVRPLRLRHLDEQGEADGYSPRALGHDAGMPPPPPPQYPRPGKLKSPRNNNGATSIPHYNTPVKPNSDSVATSYNDPPGTLVTSPTLNSPQICERKTGDPPGDQYHEIAAPQAGQIMGHRGSNKAVTFSLPPPTTPAPPFMGPPSDHYYSMELDGNSPLLSSSSPLLPPIVELWSSVECAENVPGDIGGGTVAGYAVGVSRWDAKREDVLLGEVAPLHVAEGWIDVPDKDAAEEEDLPNASGGTDKGMDDKEQLSENPKRMLRKLSSSTTAASVGAAIYNVVQEPHPHDEYFDDILNCTSPAIKKNTGDEKQYQQQPKEEAMVEETPPDIPGTDSSSHLDDDEDSNLRHRSTWNTSYKPPKLCPFEDEYSYTQQSSQDSIDWQRNVRARNASAVLVQKSIRGTLVRQRLHLLLDAVLVLQPAMRRYLARKRYLDYLKLKRSYFPRRWERSQMSVAI